MLIIHKQYELLAGKIGRIGRYSVQTLFYHFAGLPLWPQGSYFVKGSSFFGTPEEVTEIARDRKSIIAAYLVLWPLVGGVVLSASAVGLVFTEANTSLFQQDPMLFGVALQFWGAFLLSFLLLALGGVLAFALRGSVPDEELAKRAIYQRYLGLPIDPSMLLDPWSEQGNLKRAMADLVEQIGGLPGYQKRTFDQWKRIALDPRMTVLEYLHMALTTSRLIHRSEEKNARRDGILQKAKKYDEAPDDDDQDDDDDDKPAHVDEDKTISSRDAEGLHAQIWVRILQLDPQARTRRPT